MFIGFVKEIYVLVFKIVCDFILLLFFIEFNVFLILLF